MLFLRAPLKGESERGGTVESGVFLLRGPLNRPEPGGLFFLRCCALFPLSFLVFGAWGAFFALCVWFEGFGVQCSPCCFGLWCLA